MAKQSLTLESLERIVAAGDDRRLAMAALAGLREVAAGDHYSAMWFDATNCKIADYFLDQSWLAADHTFWEDCSTRASRKFKDDEIDTVRGYHRVLAGLAPFQSRAPRPTCEPSVAPGVIDPMVRLAALY